MQQTSYDYGDRFQFHRHTKADFRDICTETSLIHLENWGSIRNARIRSLSSQVYKSIWVTHIALSSLNTQSWSLLLACTY